MANIDNTSKQDKVYSDYGTQKSTKTKTKCTTKEHTQLNSDLKTMKIKLDFVSSIIIDKFKNNLDFFFKIQILKDPPYFIQSLKRTYLN